MKGPNSVFRFRSADRNAVVLETPSSLQAADRALAARWPRSYTTGQGRRKKQGQKCAREIAVGDRRCGHESQPRAFITDA